MRAREINLLLFNSIPEIRDIYEKEVSWQDGHDTGSHVVYGNVLNRYIVERIMHGDVEAVRRVMAFVEMVLEKDDEDAENVIEVTVLEYFLDYNECNPMIKAELGPRAKIVWDRLVETYK